ncbi:MAG: 4-hydroxy-tetrahydrodipicolinate synthase [Candidatus Bathyarchaeota archaeon]|nr:4-hydroxy-tetrahydrodipicolinate synthase [Candidatus Bathyarchaeota archaeon]MDH5787158.1 4-hydroxy-tetrahydrodipicolinate synthase [Candidatus Bathyarchaeota archaeon]
MQRTRLNGIFVPHVTPFAPDGNIDEEALRTCVSFWVEGGVSGLVPCGSNGEAPYLSREERMRVIKIVIDEVNGKVPVIAGTGSMSTRETILFTKDAKDLGADAALVVTPFYFKLSNREVREHYSALFEAVDLSVILYSVPKFTGFSLEPSVISQIASKYDNVVGVKDSGGSIDNIVEIIRLVGDRISVLAGAASVTLPTLMLGGTGAVIAVANVYPKMCSDLYKAFKRSDYEEAKELQRRISYINEVLVKRHNQLSAIKTALQLRGLPSGYPRRPALPLDDEERKDIENLLKNMLEKS